MVSNRRQDIELVGKIAFMRCRAGGWGVGGEVSWGP